MRDTMDAPPDTFTDDAPALAQRPADYVMSPDRAAVAVTNSLCFPRATMRELVRDRYRVRKLRFELDEQGRGEVLYRLEGGGWVFHFYLVSDLLPEQAKIDRNFAQGWDAMGVLCQGEWTPEREALLRREVPRQRAGYADYDTLMYARGNRSGRVFDHVVDRLAAGRQPDPRVLAPVGYILRTTAFIGNGQLGTRPLAGFEPGHPLRRPYHAQFCSAFALREYVFDLVEHLARVRNPQGAARLAPAMRRFIGLGNSAATGLSAFVANHPHLMHQWNQAVERALATVKTRAADPGDAVVGTFGRLLDKALRYYREGAREPDGVFSPSQELAADLHRLREPFDEFREHGSIGGVSVRRPWQALCEWARARLGAEANEVLHALLLELYPEIAEAHIDDFEADERCALRPAMTATELLRMLERDYAWALAQPAGTAPDHHFWYRCSSAPRDIRRAPRGRAPRFEIETTMDTALQARRLHAHLLAQPPGRSTARALFDRPDLRHIAARVQSLEGKDYAELRQQWLAADFSPFASIRLPLTFYGMEKFEAAQPKSVRGTFMQGAPIAEDVARGRDGDWPFPLMPAGDAGAIDELAPLPASTPPDPARLPAPSASPADVLRIAPRELARMVQTALQGHGLQLGVAEDASGLAVFAQACGEPGVDAVLRACEEGKLGPAGGQAVSLAQDAGSGRSWSMLDAHGAMALACAPQALDLAMAQAMAGPAPGVVAVRNAHEGWLLQELALRAAAQGLIALLSWHGGAPDGAAGGIALAGPGKPGPWFAAGPLAAGAALYRQVLGDDAAVLADIGAATDAIRGVPGFVLACLRRADTGASPALFAATAAMAPVLRWNEEELRRRQEGWARQGVAFTRAQFDALGRVGAALLVPQEQEAGLLDGADPIKTF